jgi:Ca2+-binding EF-hand superfamily protein
VDDLAGVYNTAAHPDVVQGKKTEKQVFTEFLSGFEGDSKGRGDGLVTWTEFLQYYTDLSGSVPSDTYFVEMMSRCWDISKADSTSKLRTLFAQLRAKVEQRTKGSKNPAETLRAAFKFFDEDESGAVKPDEFAKALERFGVILNEADTKLFFARFDKDGSGTISYDEFTSLTMKDM